MARRPKKRRPRLLGWYRVDRTDRIRRVLVLASAFVVTGALVGASALRWIVWPLGVAALALVLTGAATAIAGLRRELMEERWLALRTDGLVYARDGKTRRMPWRFVERVAVDGRALVVTLRSGKRVEIRDRFAGTNRAALEKAIERARLRAAHGLLR